MRRQSIWIMNWRVFEPKGKETKVRTIVVIGTEIGAENMLVIRGAKMTTKRKVIDMFH